MQAFHSNISMPLTQPPAPDGDRVEQNNRWRARPTASIPREMPPAKNASEKELNHLPQTRNRSGSLQVAWAPVAQSGSLAASVDGNPQWNIAWKGPKRWATATGLSMFLQKVARFGEREL